MTLSDVCTFLLRCFCIKYSNNRSENSNSKENPSRGGIGAVKRLTEGPSCTLNLAEEAAIIAAMNMQETQTYNPTTFICMERDV